MKRIIFHIPFKIDPNRSSGTNIRPLKMLQAFRSIGYHVDTIKGEGKERKASIRNIKSQIKQGVKYDLVYSESSTLPTLLTEKHHLPNYPFLDFGFFSYCKKQGIPITLFYRDIFWNFKGYSLSGIKAMYTKFMYHYDLFKYRRILDILYLPSLKMQDHIPSSFNCKVENLPPGFEQKQLNPIKALEAKLNLFYVGGFGSHYQMQELFEAVSQLDYINLTICTRKAEWLSKQKNNYAKFADLKNVQIVHKQSHELMELYEQADIAMLFVKPMDYWAFAVPIKLFEYIGNQKPIIATQDTYAGDFVEKNKIGWSIPYQSNELVKLLKELHENKEQINSKREHLAEAYINNTWEARARKVVEQVQKLKK